MIGMADYLCRTIALLFTHMKSEIDAYVERFGNDNGPPPWQLFTIANDPKAGNMHIVQKVFQGPFEVCCVGTITGSELIIVISLMSSSPRHQLLSMSLVSTLITRE